jgi:hypothetical protein
MGINDFRAVDRVKRALEGGAVCRPSGVGSRVNRGVNDPPRVRAV